MMQQKCPGPIASGKKYWGFISFVRLTDRGQQLVKKKIPNSYNQSHFFCIELQFITFKSEIPQPAPKTAVTDDIVVDSDLLETLTDHNCKQVLFSLFSLNFLRISKSFLIKKAKMEVRIWSCGKNVKITG